MDRHNKKGISEMLEVQRATPETRQDTRKAEDCDKDNHLGTETVQGAALALECVNNVERGDGLALGVLSVGDRVTNHRLEEELQNTTGLVVDKTRDTLDTTSTRKTTDSGLGDTLDVVSQDLIVAEEMAKMRAFQSATCNQWRKQ